ncbi:hypothetical protein PVK06_000820 [Gossypium arboreum]|uniref:Uncharacterized protein n=1 Tax=Gossypium arboreum TaxID=29729 RepID=A0ABR0QZJ0_GOSAR|nr:hypothetical protein PVK06_000820 [Gossypium arboreum]
MSVNQNWSKIKMKEEDSPSLCIMLLFNKYSILVYIKDNNKKIPLYLAVEKGSIKMVDESQHNLLDLATMNGNLHAVKYSLNLVEIEDLVNPPDVDGNTALHLAETNYHSNVVTILSEKTNLKVRAVKFLLAFYRSKRRKQDLEQRRKMQEIFYLVTNIQQGMKNLFSLIFITINKAIHAFYRQFSLPNTTTQHSKL